MSLIGPLHMEHNFQHLQLAEHGVLARSASEVAIMTSEVVASTSNIGGEQYGMAVEPLKVVIETVSRLNVAKHILANTPFHRHWLTILVLNPSFATITSDA